MTYEAFRDAVLNGKRRFENERFEHTLLELHIEDLTFVKCFFYDFTTRTCIFRCKFIKCVFKNVYIPARFINRAFPNIIQDCSGDYSTLVTEPVHHQRVIRPAFIKDDTENKIENDTENE